jgi:inosine-uridine nucleoside N-ribohydrolase
MKFKQIFFLAIVATFAFNSSLMAQKKALTVIFETDMGNDIDDVLALDMLYKYQDAGIVNIAAISNNKGNIYSIPFIDLLNRWYGYPNIPLGNVQNTKVREGKKTSYVEYVSNLKNEKESSLFEKQFNQSSAVQGSVEMYRKVLSAQPDQSVIIISVGFLTNLSRLINSPADKYSPLNGKELISKKVKFMSLMGGDFRAENTPAHPLKYAYEYYSAMPYDRPTWDLTSVLYAVEPLKRYFTVSKAGFINTDDKGATFFNKAKKGNRYILTADKKQQERMLLRFTELVKQKPKLR